MSHARRTPAPGPRSRLPHPPDRPDLVAVLRDVIADADHLDPAVLALLGDAPVRTAAEASARLDGLARALVDRMSAAAWDEGEAPRAVTSVLAASVPEAEAALLRAARSRRR